MRLIDANVLPVKTSQRKQYVLYTAIEDAPTIDAVPVVHGQWKSVNGTLFCSECNHCFNILPLFAHYCPNCGARMDGDE